MFTEEEKVAIKMLVKRELDQVKDDEKKLRVIEANSPYLSTVVMHDADIPFLASAEKYHQLLEQLDKKLDKEWKKS